VLRYCDVSEKEEDFWKKMVVSSGILVLTRAPVLWLSGTC
jgi:hypothetical protein